MHIRNNSLVNNSFSLLFDEVHFSSSASFLFLPFSLLPFWPTSSTDSFLWWCSHPPAPLSFPSTKEPTSRTTIPTAFHRPSGTFFICFSLFLLRLLCIKLRFPWIFREQHGSLLLFLPLNPICCQLRKLTHHPLCFPWWNPSTSILICKFIRLSDRKLQKLLGNLADSWESGFETVPGQLYPKVAVAWVFRPLWHFWKRNRCRWYSE